MRTHSLPIEPPSIPTVLLVEDAHDDRHMYAEFLRHQHLRAVEIGNTADALALASTVDLIVTGISVPGPFDGIELIRRLRSAPETKDKPIIVVTACAVEPNQQLAHAAGCDAFLPKPCLPQTLVGCIGRLLPIPSQPDRNDAMGTTRKRSIVRP